MSGVRSGSLHRPSRTGRRAVLIVIAGLMVLALGFTYHYVAMDSHRDDQAIYDATEGIVTEVNSWDHLRATNVTGADYDYVVLSKPALEWFADHPDEFLDHFDVGYRYRVTFDDLNISDAQSDPDHNMSSRYVFGGRPTSSADVAVLEVHYALDLHITHLGEYYPHIRHVCLMRVEVWR